MNGTLLRKTLQEILPSDLIVELAQELGVITRQRKRDIVAQVAALVLSTGSDDSGRFADAYRRYQGDASATVVRGAFYGWLDDSLAELMQALLDRAIGLASQEMVILPKICQDLDDWVIVDSETVTLRPALGASYAGTGSTAAIKVHKDLSVGRGVMSAYHLSAATEHDCPHLTVDERYRNKGLLIDLGYVSLDLIRRCKLYLVKYIMRLKSNWQPQVTTWHEGALGGELFPGMNFRFAMRRGVVVLDGSPIDAEVTLGHGSKRVRARLVGICGPDGYLFYLTNLDRDAYTPDMVAELYRVRWEIECDNKLDKSGCRLDQVRATTVSSLKILLFSSLLHSVLVDLMVHRDRLQRLREEAVTRAPMHRLLVSLALNDQNAQLVDALVNGASQRCWDKCARVIDTTGRDPNWRNRPSVLDRLVGIVAPPGRPRRAKLAECPVSAKPYRNNKSTIIDMAA